MEAGDQLALILSALAVLATGALVTAEIALTRVSRVRALAWAEDGRRGAARLARLLERPEQANAVLALVRVVLRTAATAAVGVVGWREGDLAGAVIAVVALVVAVALVGEVMPRRLAARYGERIAVLVASPVAALTRLVPMAERFVVTGGTAEAEGEGNGEQAGDGEAEIDEDERQLIHSVFEFGDTVVREVMVPRTDMVTVDADTTLDAALDTAIRGGFSRIPVHQGNGDNIVGLVYLKDLIRASRQSRGGEKVMGHVRKAVFVPEQKRVAELLREMQTRKFHMAIAVDEYGGVAGLVTLEDLLEEIVGEIVDEYDVEEPRVEEVGDGVLRVAGRTPIDEVNDLLDVELPSGEWDTVGGLIFDLVGHVPAEGEAVTFQGIEFTAERIQGRRIVSVRVRRVTPPAVAAPA